MSAFKVLIPQDIPEEGKQYLRDNGYEVIMGSGFSADTIKQEVVDCDAMLVRTAQYPAEVLEAGKKLKVVSRFGVGVDNIDVAKATELGIQVTNGPESNSSTVSELVLGFILGLGRNLIICDRETRNNNFAIRSTIRGIDIEGKTLGVLGMGKIGRLVARKAHLGLGMHILGYDPYLPEEDFPREVTRVESWDEVFTESDYVTIHIPSTPKTKGSIGKREFSLMKPTAFIINAARGDIIVEDDLIVALQNGTIKGGGFDVYREEPPMDDHPFFTMDNVMLTPHNASLTNECMVKMALHAAQGIHEVLSGQKPSWPVNEPIR